MKGTLQHQMITMLMITSSIPCIMGFSPVTTHTTSGTTHRNTSLKAQLDNSPSSRSKFIRSSTKAAGASILATIGIVGGVSGGPSPDTTAYALEPKLTNLSNEEIAKIVKSDMVEKSFLATAKLTRSIYDDKSIFTDEIDSYPIEKWIKGTQKLFVGPPSSNVQLDGDVVATDTQVTFRFAEDLMFRIPPLYPVVTLSGSVILERDGKTGLITSYREVWDQSVNEVLKTAKFPSFFKSPAEYS